GSGGATSGSLFSVCSKRFAHPGAFFVSPYSSAQTFAVAGPIAAQHGIELFPVDLAEVVLAALLVPLQIWIGDGQAQVVGLRHSLVDKFLSQFIIGKQLDAPLHRLGAVWRILIGWPEHHERRPPPAVQRFLRHLFLFCRALTAKLDKQVVTLALVEGLFLTDPYHCPGVRPIRT